MHADRMGEKRRLTPEATIPVTGTGPIEDPDRDYLHSIHANRFGSSSTANELDQSSNLHFLQLFLIRGDFHTGVTLTNPPSPST